MEQHTATCIITAVDSKYEMNFIKDFLPSLRHTAAYTGSIIVLDYGMTSSAIRASERYNITFIEPPINESINITTRRFVDCVQVIRNLNHSIKQVMLIDAADVWFQAPFDNLWRLNPNGINLVYEDFVTEQCIMKDWIKMMPSSISEEYCDTLKEKKVLNCGMIVGSKTLIQQLVIDLSQEVKKIGNIAWGQDQAIINFLLQKHTLAYNFLGVNDKYNYMLNNKIYDLQIVNNKIYNSFGELVPIVHNAGNTVRIINGSINEYNADELSMLIRKQRTERFFDKGYRFFENHQIPEARYYLFRSITRGSSKHYPSYVYLFISFLPKPLIQCGRLFKRRISHMFFS